MYLATWCSRVLTYPWMFLVLLPSQIFLPLNSITLLYCPMLVFLTQTLHTFFMSYNWPSVWVYGLLPCILHSCCNQLQWVLACGLIFPYLTVSSQGEGTIPMHLLFSFFFFFTCVCVCTWVCMCLWWWGGHICRGVYMWEPKADTRSLSWLTCTLFIEAGPLSWTYWRWYVT